MGGFGSTRWGWYRKKTQVEECLKFSIFSIKDYLKPSIKGASYWYRGEIKIASIGYSVQGEEKPTSIRFEYSVTQHNDETFNQKYNIHLTTTPLAWGSERYWFVCPLSVNGENCFRRVGCLYLPPQELYFGCRHCYDLTYRSSQESGQFKQIYESLAASMQAENPGINAQDVRFLLEGKQTQYMEQLAVEKFLREWEPPPDRYADYLTPEEMCSQSGLSPKDLRELKDIRLLVPDSPDSRYRPKLVGWAIKLDYLLGEGWGLNEIKCWAKGRFQKKNPKEWPPEK